MCSSYYIIIHRQLYKLSKRADTYKEENINRKNHSYIQKMNWTQMWYPKAPIHFIFFPVRFWEQRPNCWLVAFLGPENYGLYEAPTRYFNEWISVRQSSSGFSYFGVSYEQRHQVSFLQTIFTDSGSRSCDGLACSEVSIKDKIF